MKKLRSYILAFFCAAGTISLLTYTILIEPNRVEVVQYDLRKSGEPETLRLVQVSDLHLQDFGRQEKELAGQIAALNPDVVVLSGDAIDRLEAVSWLRAFVKELVNVQVLLVPGNWEHWSDVSLESLNSTGVTLLLNQRWSFSKGKRRLSVIGLDDYTAGQPDLGLLSVNTSVDSGQTTVLVQHSPGFFDQASVNQQMKSTRFDLCLSGHTHGGQVSVFGWAPMRPVGSGRFTAGFYDVVGCPLYVSRGLGTSVMPIRLGARPELVVFDL